MEAADAVHEASYSTTLATLVDEVELLTQRMEEESAGGAVISSELGEKLRGVVSAERVKVDAIARVLKLLQNQAAICEMEIVELESRRARLLKTKENLAAYVMLVMQGYGYKKLEGNLHRLTVVAGRMSVALEPDAIERLPLTLTRTIPAKVEPDKTAIKAALEAGEKVPGASMVTGEPHLRVYT